MPTAKSDRIKDAERKRRKRLQEKLVVIPQCADRARREKLEGDDIAWLMHYFGPDSNVLDPFTYEFTSQQREMIDSFGVAIREGGDQAIAASRGEGKSTIFERLTLKYTLQGILKFTALFQATGAMADNSLDTMKTAIEENVLLLADYPEVCVPVAALENTPSRAHYQVVSGFRHDNGEPFEAASSRFTWCGQEVIFPKVPGSPSSEAIIATRGLDSAVRGLKKRGRRPQLAGIDDPDTEETSRSEVQARKLEDRIDKAIGGLGSQKQPIARIMLTTIQSRTSASYKFTDQAAKPSWKGRRFRFLLKPPEHVDLWEEYVQLQQEDWRNSTTHAHEFYVKNREKMEKGAEVANPNRYAVGELSALQHYYNLVAKLGREAVAIEYDNDPPEVEETIGNELTSRHIQWRLSGLERGVVPPPATLIVRGVDARKSGLHWVIRAFCPDGTNYTIDYGFKETHGVRHGTDEGVDLAIKAAIMELYEEQKAYQKPDTIGSDGEVIAGEILPISITLVDSGYMTDAVYSACLEIGTGDIFPAKGHGQSMGCASSSFRPMARRSKDTQPGDGWFLKLQPTGVWLAHCDTDRWKDYEHNRWLTDEGNPGASFLFGSISPEEEKWASQRLPRDVKDHSSYGRHITAEARVEEVIRGVLQSRWRTKPGRSANHYLDASYLTNVGANMRGVNILQSAVNKQQKPKRPLVVSSGRSKQARW